jgi:hypothetical protein
MKENFELLFERVLDCLDKNDLIALYQQLDEIKGNTIVIGNGGSSVVADFAAKAIDTGGIVSIKNARDLNYENLDLYKNILICSNSGKGYIVENAKGKVDNIYLLTNGNVSYDGIKTIKYDTSINKENSFISLGTTLMPMSLLYYYTHRGLRLPHFESIIENMFNKASRDINIGNNKVYEIITGCEFSSATKFLETTFVESGIAIPIIQEKSNYCHGRTTTSYKNNHGLIMFDADTNFDEILKNNLSNYYNEIILIEKYYNGVIKAYLENDYYATIKAMFLSKKLAENKNLDLSDVDYSPMVKKLYYYKGDM